MDERAGAGAPGYGGLRHDESQDWRSQFCCDFLIRRSYSARHGVSCNGDFELHESRFSHFNEKIISRLCGNACLVCGQRMVILTFFEGGLLCVEN